MEYLKFILYGLIQGLTEFVPISSTAHLKIISLWLNIEDPGSSISAIIQFGSVIAVFWYFRQDIFFTRFSSSQNFYKSFLSNKLLKSILIGTIPFVLFGAVIKLIIPQYFYTALRSNYSIAIISLLMALFMFIADNSKRRFININNHNYLDSFWIGLSQAFAIFPGVSRSGITISTALLSGWKKKDAAKFSFLLGIPAISVAAIVEFIFSLNELSKFNIFPLIVGLVTTFLSSLLAIGFLLKYLSSHGMKLFILYRLIFGIMILFNLYSL